MRGMSGRAVLVVVVVAVPCSVRTEDGVSPQLRVRVYGAGVVSVATRVKAQAIADAALQQIAASVDWVDCSGADVESLCAQRTTSGDLFVRIVPRRRDVGSKACGVSLKPAGSMPGHYITVYADCVRDGADRLQVPEAVILAYTILHEIGHLLLPEGHSLTGIMRARPNCLDWQRAALEGLRFTDREMHQIRATLRQGVPPAVSAR